MSEIKVGIRLTADGKGLVGEIRLTKKEIDQLTGSLDKSGKEARAASGGLDKYGKKSDSASRKTEKLGGKVKGLREQFFGLKSMIATLGFGLFIRSATSSALAMDRYSRTLKFGAGNARKMAFEQNFLRQKSEELGLVFLDQVSSFAKLTAAARGTRLEGGAVREVWLGLAEAGTVLSFNQEQMVGATRALEQIMSKGTVQAEELRGQLGDRMPGAFQIAARAMGKTTAELNKMLDNGELLSSEFIPRFAKQLRKEFGPNLADAMKSPQAELNRFTNQVNAARIQFGQGFIGGLIDSTKEFKSVLKELVDDGTLKGFGKNLGDIARFLGQNIKLIKSAAIGYGSYRLALLALPAILTAVTGGVTALSAALLANPLVLVAAGVGVLIGAYSLLNDKNEELARIEKERLGRKDQLVKEQEDIAKATVEQASAIDVLFQSKSRFQQQKIAADLRAKQTALAALKVDSAAGANSSVLGGFGSKDEKKIDALTKEINTLKKALEEVKAAAISSSDSIKDKVATAALKAAAATARSMARAAKFVRGLKGEYISLAGSLDPAIQRQQKFNAVDTKLVELYSTGLIPSLTELNRLRGIAQDKYLPTSVKFLSQINQQMADEIRLLGLSDEARQTELAVRDVLNKAKAKGIKLTATEIKNIRAVTKAHIAAAKAITKRKKAAVAAAAAVTKVWDTAREDIQRSLAQTFDDFLAGNLNSVRAFWASFKAIGRRAIANLLAAKLFTKALSFSGGGISATGKSGGFVAGFASIAGTLKSGFHSLSSGLNKFGTKLGFGKISGATGNLLPGKLVSGTLSGTIGAGLGGAAAGSILSDLLGLGKVGSGILTGAGAGFAIGGPVGAAIGAIIGGIAGLFKKTPWARVGISATSSGFQVGRVSTRGSGNKAGASKLGGATAQFLQSIRDITGGSFSGNLGNIGIRKDKFFFQTGDNGRRQDFNTAEEAIAALLKNALNSGKVDLSDTFRTILKNSIDKGSEQIVKDLQFGKIFDKLTFNDTLGKAERKLQDLADKFKEVGRRAKALGLDVSKVSDAFKREIGRLRTEFRDRIDLAILQFTSPLDAALKIQFDAQKQRLEEARALGADLVNVERLNLLEREQLIKNFAGSAGQALTGLNTDVADFIKSIKIGPDSQLSKGDQLRAAEARFNDLLGRARAGDTQAIGNITGAASDLRNLSKDVFASSSQFFERERFISESLVNLQATLQNQKTDTVGNVPAATIDNVFPDLAQGLDQVNGTIIDGNNIAEKLLTEIRDLLDPATAQAPDYGQFIPGGFNFGGGGSSIFSGFDRFQRAR